MVHVGALSRALYRHVRLPRHPARRAGTPALRETTYGWNIEMQMRAARAGLRILELPVPYRCRIGGQSKVAGTLGGSLRAAWRIATTLVRVAVADGPTPYSPKSSTTP
jgi:hypothetical protein